MTAANHHDHLTDPSAYAISEVGAPGRSGLIGIAPCPGWGRPGSRSPAEWRRDLRSDLWSARRWGAEVVVCLLEAHEAQPLGLQELSSSVEGSGLIWLHLPITDGGAPGDSFERSWGEVGPLIHGTLLDGGRVLVHCLEGLGRSGTVAARLLIESGVEPRSALSRVRQARPGAVETTAQEEYLRRLPHRDLPAQGTRRCRARARTSTGHFSACLLAGAVGDALGASLEFKRLDEIRAEHGPDGLRDLAPSYGALGSITDDTQMTLFTAEGLLDAVSGGASTIATFAAAHHAACLRWLATQNVGARRLAPGDASAPIPAGAAPGAAGLLALPRLHSRRAPGTTCLSSLESGSMGTPDHPLNSSKGCGGVMRAAPVGLFVRAPKVGPSDPADTAPDTAAFALASACAAVTHGHPSGYLAAGALALLISRILSGDPLESGLRAAIKALCSHPEGEECARAVEAALSLWHGRAPISAETVESLGGGWVAEEALSISVFCALAAGDDLREGLLLAANHSGDSDSTAAICGNILGALLGARAVPQPWLEVLELRETVEQLAVMLHACEAGLPS